MTGPPRPSRCQRSSVGLTLVRPEELRPEHGGVAHDVEHDPVAAGLVVGVHRVEDVAGLDVVPDDVGGVAVAGQQADPGVVALLPVVREAGAGARGLQVEGHRQVEQDDPALGDGAVVHADRPAHGDPARRAHAGVGPDDADVDVVAPAPEVGHGVEVAGARVALGVRGVPTGQRAAEVARPDRLELVGQLVGQRTGLDDGERAARMADDVGVRRRSPCRRAPARAAASPRGLRPRRRSAPNGSGTTRRGRRASGSRAPCRHR